MRCGGYIVSWCNYNAEPQADGEPVHEKGTILGIGCPRRFDRGSGSGAGWGGTVTGDYCQSRGVDPQTDQEAGSARATAGLLRSGADGLCSVLAADGLGDEVR